MSDTNNEPKNSIQQRITNEQLLSYLIQKGERHQYFNHYTNISSLSGMLENKKLYLTRADRLNDFNEGGQVKEKRNVFIVSFSCRTPESIAMWSMYAAPYCEGICLRIDGKSLRAFLKSFNATPLLYPIIGDDKDKPISFSGKAKLFIVEVVYANKNEPLDIYIYKNQDSIMHAKKINRNTPPPSESLLNWCIKDRIWEAENEARLVLELDRPFSDLEKVAIDFSKALQDLRIICGPCVDDSNVRNNLKGQDIIEVLPSKYYNKTFFKSCSKNGCNRTDFCKNRNP